MTRRPALPLRRRQDRRFHDSPMLQRAVCGAECEAWAFSLLSAVRNIMSVVTVAPVVFAAGAMIRFHTWLTVNRERFQW
jgi:hypothetical protein